MIRSLMLASVVAIALLQAACCNKSSGQACTSTIRYKGKTYSAKSETSDAKSDSTRLACRKYCKTDDPAVQKAWRLWKASPEGLKSTRDREAEMEIRTDLFSAVNECQNPCVAEMVLSPALATVLCEP